MDSTDKTWAIFWVTIGAVLLAVTFAISYCSVRSDQVKYDVQKLCIERNGTWTTKRYPGTRDTTPKTVHNCQFTF